jgi:hypothetical protein
MRVRRFVTAGKPQLKTAPPFYHTVFIIPPSTAGLTPVMFDAARVRKNAPALQNSFNIAIAT